MVLWTPGVRADQPGGAAAEVEELRSSLQGLAGAGVGRSGEYCSLPSCLGPCTLAFPCPAAFSGPLLCVL